jgi:tRNA threonylcarbamoyladenosine biosynthesis protein TsaE
MFELQNDCKYMSKTITQSPEQTMEVAKRLGEKLKPGHVVCLNGDLGTGKTAFTTGIARSLGIDGYITSPTFTIVNEYTTGSLKMYHFDVYRIDNEDEMFEIGFEEYINGDAITVIEWADLIKGILPENRIEVLLEKDLSKGENVRVITIKCKGAVCL